VELLHVRGDSMWPTLRDGELVGGSWEPAERLRPGSIIGFHGGDGRRLVVHRFVRILQPSGVGPALMRTRGEGRRPDDLRPAPQEVFVVRCMLRLGRWVRPGNCMAYSAFLVLMEVATGRRKGSYYHSLPATLRRIGRWLRGFEKISE